MAWFCSKRVIAANIDSESATDGHVLTADGSGNSAWEAASGGSGSFLFDAMTITVGEPSGGYWPVTFSPTLNGVAVTDHLAFWVHITKLSDGAFATTSDATVIDSTGTTFCSETYATYLHWDDEGTYRFFTEVADTYYIHVMLPTAGWATSNAIVYSI